MPPGKYIIGLTGNIGTGKTRVRKLLEELGAFTIDADKLAHRLMARGSPVYQEVVESFGPGILATGGEIDRKKLAERVFSQPPELGKLEKIVHPVVAREAFRMAQAAPAAVVVIEAVKLVEAGMDAYCNEVWLVTSPWEVARERLSRERGWTLEEAERRLKVQPRVEERLALAHAVIDNSGDFAQTERKVREEWQRVIAKVAGGKP